MPNTVSALPCRSRGTCPHTLSTPRWPRASWTWRRPSSCRPWWAGRPWGRSGRSCAQECKARWIFGRRRQEPHSGSSWLDFGPGSRRVHPCSYTGPFGLAAGWHRGPTRDHTRDCHRLLCFWWLHFELWQRLWFAAVCRFSVIVVNGCLI